MLVKINESMAEDKFKDPTINKDTALWNDTRPHYNVGHVVPERDIKFEVIKGHEDHGPQPILVWNGKRLRPRAEMIVFNDKTGEILVRDNPSYKNSNVPFELPGGGLMEGKSFLETAIIEVKQEVRMNVRDSWDSHIYYINQSPDGTEQEWTTWGDYSQICCGICDSLYTGEIDDQDKDEDMARDAKWVKIEEVNLTPAHEEAIRLYKKENGLDKSIGLNESILISDKDLVWNLDKWKRGDINLLFICGYSGSGKSTLSKILAKKYNCTLSEMDMENQEMKETYKDEFSKLGPGGTIENPNKGKFFVRKYIERYGNRDKHIIEGGQLCGAGFDSLKDYAVIFKGTSAITSSMRAWKRAWIDDENAERWSPDKTPLGKFKFKMAQGANRLHANLKKIGPKMEQFYQDMKKAGAKEMEYEDIIGTNTGDLHIPLLISGNDIYYNFDKWDKGECKTIFVLGLSGSGKSTLGKKLAKKYNAQYVETDKIRGNSHYSDEEMKKTHSLIYKWFTTQYKGDRNGFNDLPKDVRKKEWNRCVSWILNQKERKVIEGAVEEFLIEHPEYNDYPMVFKNTSMIKSMFRMTKRQLFERPECKVDTAFLKWWWKFIHKYDEMRDLNNQVRDKVLDGKKYDTVHETFGPHIDRTFLEMDLSCLMRNKER